VCASGTDLTYYLYLVFFSSQRDKETKHEPDPQNAGCQQGKNRGIRSYVRLKHIGL
jgi:hypothetical protein